MTNGIEGEGLTLPADPEVIRAAARTVLEGNWRPEGYTVPNAEVYPFQWLWDSCFHAIVWADLGEPDRARSELAHVFRTQNSEGFVPHVDYEFAPAHHASFWNRKGQSSITQPPMFGHAIAELARRNIRVDDLVGPATAGLEFLLDRRARIDGLVALCHPWESGGDDCPRWDHWCTGPWDKSQWFDVKGALLASVHYSPVGSPLSNPSFVVASCGFNALVAFNAAELAGVTGDQSLLRKAAELSDQLATRWIESVGTWVDVGDSEGDSGAVRSLDALLPVLMSTDRSIQDDVFAQLSEESAFGGRFGPAGVHRDEPTFMARTYWRGPAWPQLTYLFWVAARRHGRVEDATALAGMLTRGAVASSWAEYWDANDGTGLGAAPQSWAALAAVVH
ncbi:MAG: hypothetical protein WEA11_00750 [Acidimicrobiales bacterium]